MAYWLTDVSRLYGLLLKYRLLDKSWDQSTEKRADTKQTIYFTRPYWILALIKYQLSAKDMPSLMEGSRKKERQASGPFPSRPIP